MKSEIPIVFCFNNKYVIPAAVTFYSLLEHANPEYNYRLHVLHSNVTQENQIKLNKTVDRFDHCSAIEFLQMSRLDQIWSKIVRKAHFSKEAIYKYIFGSIFPNYDKVVFSDVDVVYLDDISDSYHCISNDDYLAAVRPVSKILTFMERYKTLFSEEEIKILSGFCSGYLVMNLNKMRLIENQMLEFIDKEGHRLVQPGQDLLNLFCHTNVHLLPLRYLVCSYTWELYQNDLKDDYYSEEEIQTAMNSPVQLHYATGIKPWDNPCSTKANEWYKYLVKTPFKPAKLF